VFLSPLGDNDVYISIKVGMFGNFYVEFKFVLDENGKIFCKR
jgi:hypothetical protein